MTTTPQPDGQRPTSGPGHGPTDDYAAHRTRVAEARRRMRNLVDGEHTAAEARAAALALTAALRDATAAATQALQDASSADAGRRRRFGRRDDVRAVSAASRQWSAELVHLAELGAWLRTTTLDHLGVHVPAGVQVAGYAALGPHVAGLEGGEGFLSSGAPRIGVDLRAVVDEPAVSPAPMR